MVWTAIMTAVPGAVLTAAHWNTYVRDNLNETAVAKATTAGGFFVATGVNSLAERFVGYAENLTTVKGNVASYGDLPASVGPSVTVDTGTKAIVMWSAMANTDVADAPAGASYAVSGATTIAASSDRRIWFDGMPANNAQTQSTMYFHTNLNAGSNTFTMKFLSDTGGVDWEQRKILVIPF